MGRFRQAKILSRAQADALLSALAFGRNGKRNSLIVLLSLRAGLRAHEIANLMWRMVLDPEGNVGSAIFFGKLRE